MKLDIHIELDNDAFADSPTDEIRRILKEVCDRITYDSYKAGYHKNIFDINGNTVGSVEITEE